MYEKNSEQKIFRGLFAGFPPKNSALSNKSHLERRLLGVIAERLERSTGSLEGCCSIQLSYATKAEAVTFY